jgi:hypothetical protein
MKTECLNRVVFTSLLLSFLSGCGIPWVASRSYLPKEGESASTIKIISTSPTSIYLFEEESCDRSGFGNEAGYLTPTFNIQAKEIQVRADKRLYVRLVASEVTSIRGGTAGRIESTTKQCSIDLSFVPVQRAFYTINYSLLGQRCSARVIRNTHTSNGGSQIEEPSSRLECSSKR